MISGFLKKVFLPTSADLTDSKNLNGFKGKTNSGSPYRTIYNETVTNLNASCFFKR